VRLLAARFDPDAPRAPEALGVPIAQVAAAGTALVGLGCAIERTALASISGRALQQAGVHGALISCALILAGADRRAWRRAGSVVVATIFLAACLAVLSPWGAVTYALPPAALALMAGRTPWGRRNGLGSPRRRSALVAGGAVGCLLGVHLLITASLTFGYTVGMPSRSAYLVALGYDVGANALSAAFLFQGALFSRLWRTLDFWPATALTTAAGLARYLLDPALPRATEAAAGAVFYLAVLGIAGCALRAWSSSAAPAYLASVGFLAAYRCLSGW
jgi:hypothetical protein